MSLRDKLPGLNLIEFGEKIASKIQPKKVMKKVILLLAIAFCFGTLSTQAFPQWDNLPDLSVSNLPTGSFDGTSVPAVFGQGVGYGQCVYYIVSVRNMPSGSTFSYIWRWNPSTGWDISNVASFGQDEKPMCLGIHDHFLYAAGDFTGVWYGTSSFASATDIAKMDLDTGIWSAVGNDSITNVHHSQFESMTIDNAGNVYVGGMMNLYSEDPDDPNYPFGALIWDPIGVLKWDGTNWTEIGAKSEPAGLDPIDSMGIYENSITGLATDGTNIFVLGGFDGAFRTNGSFVPSRGIIKFDGNDWVQMGINTSGLTIGTNTFTGLLPTTPNDFYEPITDPYSICVVGTNVFATGPFSLPHPCIARFSTVTGNSLTITNLTLAGVTPPEGTNNNYPGVLLSLAAHEGKVYLAGNFDHVGGLAAMSIASWTNDGSIAGSWANLGSGLTLGGTNGGGGEYLVANSNAVFVTSGSFDAAGGLSIPNDPRIARWLTGPDAPHVNSGFNADTDGAINDLAIQNDGKILIAGSFTHVNGQNRPYVARLNADGSVDTAFNPTNAINTYMAAVYCIAVDSLHRVYVGGDSDIGGRLIRLKSDGTLDKYDDYGDDYIFNSDGTISAMSGNGRELPLTEALEVAGVFSTIELITNYGCADIAITTNNASWVDSGSLWNEGSGGVIPFPASAWVSAVLHPDWLHVIVCGDIGTMDGDWEIGFARHPGDTNITFNGGADCPIWAMAMQSDGKIVVGGQFGALGTPDPWSGGGSAHDRLGRFNSDGSVDDTFNPTLTTGGDVFSILLQSDGKILVGDNAIQRFNADGSTDSSLFFNCNGRANKMVQAPDGKIIAVGSFTSFGGESHTNIVEFFP